MADAVVRSDWYPVFGSGSTYVYQLPGIPTAQVLRVFNAEAVAGVTTVDSLAPIVGGATGPTGFRLFDFEDFALWVQASGTTINVKVQLLLSYNDTTTNYVVPETGGTIITVTDQNPHVVSVTPVKMPWVRVRLLGQGANGADTTISAFLLMAGEA